METGKKPFKPECFWFWTFWLAHCGFCIYSGRDRGVAGRNRFKLTDHLKFLTTIVYSCILTPGRLVISVAQAGEFNRQGPLQELFFEKSA